MTAGGNLLVFPGDPSSPAVSMLNSKLHINSTIYDSHKGDRYLRIDIKKFYLDTLMKYYKYICVLPSMIPQEISDDPAYEIHTVVDGFVYIIICRGIYGLKESGVIAFEQLLHKLEPYGYVPMHFTHSYWRHDTGPTMFTLCVENFGVNNFSKDDAIHLINAVKDNQKITTGCTGSLYCGLTLDCHYNEGFVNISLIGNFHCSIRTFDHPPPKRPQHNTQQMGQKYSWFTPKIATNHQIHLRTH